MAAGQVTGLLGPPRWVGEHNGPLLGPAGEHGLLSDEAMGTAGRPLVCQVHLTLVQPALLEVVVRHRGVALLPAGGEEGQAWGTKLARLPPPAAACCGSPSPGTPTEPLPGPREGQHRPGKSGPAHRSQRPGFDTASASGKLADAGPETYSLSINNPSIKWRWALETTGPGRSRLRSAGAMAEDTRAPVILPTCSLSKLRREQKINIGDLLCPLHTCYLQ